MSFYNMVQGVHPTAGNVLEMLGVDPEDCGRFRDAYITKEGWLAIYTRCGGNNRADYQDAIQRLRTHPEFVRDEDDDFDNTYCTFLFTIPHEHAEEVQDYFKAIREHGREDLLKTPQERFEDVIAELKGMAR